SEGSSPLMRYTGSAAVTGAPFGWRGEFLFPRRGPNPTSSPVSRPHGAFGKGRRSRPARSLVHPSGGGVNSFSPGGAPTPPPRRFRGHMGPSARGGDHDRRGHDTDASSTAAMVSHTRRVPLTSWALTIRQPS